MDTHCINSECGWLFAIFALSGLGAGSLVGLMLNFTQAKDICDNNGSTCTCVTRPDRGYQRLLFKRAKKLCIAAQNSSTLTRVSEELTFLPEGIEIEKLKLETQDSKPDFSRTNYILCCAETSGRGIILSDNEPDQLGAIITHAENARAHCAILVLGTQDPEEGELYDKSQLDVMVQSQTKLQAYIDGRTLFSFRSKLHEEQKNAIVNWLHHRD